MDKFTGLWPHQFRGERPVNAALALIADKRSATEAVGDILVAQYGHLKGTTKHIARAADCNVRAAENWPQKRVLPDAMHFLRLAMNTPMLNAAVMWLMQNGPAHPEAQKYLEEIQRFQNAQQEEGDRV